MGKNTDGSLPFVGRNFQQQMLREFNIENEIVGSIGKTTYSIRETIAIRHIGLDIEDRRTIH